jgi:hypothetical protein
VLADDPPDSGKDDAARLAVTPGEAVTTRLTVSAKKPSAFRETVDMPVAPGSWEVELGFAESVKSFTLEKLPLVTVSDAEPA